MCIYAGEYVNNYQPVRARRVFKGELKEALGGPSYPESTPLDQRRGGSLCWLTGKLYFGSIVILNVVSGTWKQ